MARAPQPMTEIVFVISRDGANLRATPDKQLAPRRLLPVGTRLHVLSRVDGWFKVDLNGDGLADGFVFAELTGPNAVVAADGDSFEDRIPPRADVLDRLTPTVVRRMFVAGTKLSAITEHLPSVVAGLRHFGIGDRSMALMALATIRAETEGFLPISEGQSQFNTAVRPFDRYDAGTEIGQRLGNTRAGDGARFKGRGFVQLTGRFNYGEAGGQVGVDLAGDPERANDSAVAGLVLAAFLFRREAAVRQALAERNLRKARRLVNGGSHGLDRFIDAFAKGEQLI